MKVLFVCTFKSSSIGRSSYTHRIVEIERYCRKLGAETSLLFLGDFFFSSPLLIQPFSLPFVLRRLRQFDVIHAGGGSAYFMALAKPFISNKTIVVYDVHGDAFTESRLVVKGHLDLVGNFNAFQMRIAEYFGFNAAEYFVTSSRRLKHRLMSRNRRINSRNIEVILNGVDLEKFRPQEPKSSPQKRGLVVTYAGSFRPWQGIENLVRAAEILAKEDIQFKLIGFGNNDSLVKEDIRKRIGKKALLIDWLPRAKLLAELQDSDVLVIPADASNRKQSENRVVTYATKFAEFIAMAKPVIVTNLEEASSLVERHDCGFVCEPTAESIANAILKANGMSRDVLINKGFNGRRCAETELNMNLICRKYLHFIRGILETVS